MILTIGGEKGGVGKTTIATHFTYMRLTAGRDPVLIDADPQWTATTFCAARDQSALEPRISSVQKTGKGLGKEIQSLAERYDDILIDTGGRDSPELRVALLVSDVALIPINASAFAWWTLEKVDELVGECRLQNPDLKAYVVLNRLPGNPALRNKKLNRAVDAFHGAKFQNLEMAEAVLIERTSFSDNEEVGSTVFELSQVRAKIDAAACQEITRLYEEVYNERYTVGSAAA